MLHEGRADARLVRDQAFKAIAMFLKRIEAVAAAMVRCTILLMLSLLTFSPTLSCQSKPRLMGPLQPPLPLMATKRGSSTLRQVRRVPLQAGQ
jgi:hypothetical protein